MAKPPFFATRGHMLLCQNQNCRHRGSDVLHVALTKVLEDEKLMYYKTGGSVRYTPTGCLGACSYGPVLACYRYQDAGIEEAWYYGVNLTLAKDIARAIQDKTPLPETQKYSKPIETVLKEG